MSREMYKARDRVTVKNTRNGLVEHNTGTGEDIRVSRRESDFEMKRDTPGQEPSLRGQPEQKPHKHRQPIHNEAQPLDGTAQGYDVQSQYAAILEKFHPQQGEPLPDAPKSADSRAQRKVYRQAEDIRQTSHEPAARNQGTETYGRLQFKTDDPMAGAALDNSYKHKQKKAQAQAGHTETAANGTDAKGQSPDMPEKLRFKHDAPPADTAETGDPRVQGKAHPQSVSSKGKVPLAEKFRPISAAGEKRAKTKRSLDFGDAKAPHGKKAKAKKPVQANPAKAGANAIMLNAHRKIYQAENENVGTKAAHRAEMTGEAGVRSALRHHRDAAKQQAAANPGNAPQHRAVKTENVQHQKQTKLTHKKPPAQDTKQKTGKLSKALRKQKAKRQYAKAAHDAKKKAETAKKVGEETSKAARALASFVKKHPIVAVVLLILALLTVMLMSVFSTAGNLGSNSVSAIVLTTFLADDADMYAAEAAYAAMEEELQYYLDNYETLNPDYDEYIYDLDDIEHDPYVLMAILHALHEGEWAIGDVQGTLATLFDGQYILTETVTVETRTRTETEERTDPVTGDTYEEEVEVEYEYYIVTVELENFNLSHLPVYIMSEERLSRYAALMWTLGNRPDLFTGSQFPHASSLLDYQHYDIPPEHLSDEKFAEMMAEATKYLGMPYVWGGSNPSTSFDCSGFVSWVLNNTGWNVGRLGATALYGVCTPVSPSNAKPGDLVFFHSTYATSSPITHVGIYVGDGMMIHAGNPIGYASINTTYYQNHFYGFGRP